MSLTRFQAEIVKECLGRRRGCLCVPMGTGKTFIGLSIIDRIVDPIPALVVCSKTLLGSWIAEIEKFFGDKMAYDVYHKDYMPNEDFENYTPREGTDVVLTTPDVLSKIYTEHNVRNNFVSTEIEDRGAPFPVIVNRYHVPTRPFLSIGKAQEYNNAFIYALPWKCLLIDEVQQHTNIESLKCEAISAVFSKHRWATTGTPISEPKAERLMGYHFLIGDSTFPNSLPDVKRYLISDYPGLRSTMVIRTQEQLDFTLPPCSEHIITHSLTPEESAVYISLKEVIKSLQQTVRANRDNVTLVRSVNAQLLSMILYTRQFLVCPLIPYSSLMLNGSKKNEMSKCFKEEVKKLNLEKWLDDENSSRSSRIIAMIEALNKHPDERCIIFSCFRTNLNVMKHYISKDTGRPVFTVKSEDSSQKRTDVLSDFESTSNGILFLTYELGAEGLNLQQSHIVLLADVWWNDSKISQAIARVMRRGQTHTVYVYIFTSNTGIEKSLYEKHIDKRTVINSLMTGKMEGTIRKLKMKDIVAFILTNETFDVLTDARRMVR